MQNQEQKQVAQWLHNIWINGMPLSAAGIRAIDDTWRTLRKQCPRYHAGTGALKPQDMNYEYGRAPQDWIREGRLVYALYTPKAGKHPRNLFHFNVVPDYAANSTVTEKDAEAIAILCHAAPTLLAACIEVLKCLENAPDRPYEKNLLKVAIHQALNISPDLLGEHVTEPTEDQRHEARINTEQL